VLNCLDKSYDKSALSLIYLSDRTSV